MKKRYLDVPHVTEVIELVVDAREYALLQKGARVLLGQLMVQSAVVPSLESEYGQRIALEIKAVQSLAGQMEYPVPFPTPHLLNND